MIWCDKVASVPSVGVAFEPLYQSSGSLLDALSPLISTWASRKSSELALDKVTPFSLEIAGEDGFVHGVDQTRVFVDFKHRVKVDAGGVDGPSLRLLSKAKPYSELLKDATDRLVEIYAAIDEKGKRAVNQLGVVCSTRTSIDEVPPGVLNFIEYIGAPWKTTVKELNFKVVADLSKSDSFSDRCIHQLTLSPEKSEPVTFVLDFQRIYDVSGNHKASVIEERLPALSKRALEYFESFGAGEVI